MMRWRIKLIPILGSLLVPITLMVTSPQTFAYTYNGTAAANYADKYCRTTIQTTPALSTTVLILYHKVYMRAGTRKSSPTILTPGCPNTQHILATGFWIMPLFTQIHGP